MEDSPNRLRELRLARGLSQQDVADRVGCSKMQVSGLERGVREFSLSMMRRFAEVFEVSSADLLSSADNPGALNDEERALIAQLRAAGDARRQDFLKVADALVPFRGFDKNAA